MRSCLRPVERARPLLGTRVAIRVRGLPEPCAHRAIDAAFAETAEIHDRMSFHAAESDVSRLNRQALDRPVAVHPHTLAVLREAQRIAADSCGCFDITVAAQLVEWGMLPRPPCRYRPDALGSWRDIQLLAGGEVRFHRPIWIDLGGIAKGYAVDRAIDRLRRHGVVEACVNAGGDLRVLGPTSERIHLRSGAGRDGRLAVLALQDGSVASSGGGVGDQCARSHGPHVDGRQRRPIGARSFVSVVAEQCVVADALTKVVLAKRERSETLLRRYGAIAHVYLSNTGWRILGTAA